MSYFSRKSLGMVVWPFRVTVTVVNADSGQRLLWVVFIGYGSTSYFGTTFSRNKSISSLRHEERNGEVRRATVMEVKNKKAGGGKGQLAT